MRNNNLGFISDEKIYNHVRETVTRYSASFHQNLFRYAGNGWTVPPEGFDVVNEERHIFVEMKNKHNTMNLAAYSFKYYMIWRTDM